MYRWQWIPLICFAAAFISTLAVLTIGRNRALGTDRRQALLRGNGGNGNGSWEVTYDGESLQFPGWRETLPLGQAMAQAEWLFEWLSEALGEPVAVRPILVLPGWSVKRTAVSGIPVLAAWRIQAYFERMRPRAGMSDTLIERIAGQLEQRCRVVALVPAAVEKGGQSRLSRPAVN